MLRIFFSIILFVFIFQISTESFADKFPKVLSCVKGESDDFTLHLVTLIEQNENPAHQINEPRRLQTRRGGPLLTGVRVVMMIQMMWMLLVRPKPMLLLKKMMTTVFHTEPDETQNKERKHKTETQL